MLKLWGDSGFHADCSPGRKGGRVGGSGGEGGGQQITKTH